MKKMEKGGKNLTLKPNAEISDVFWRGEF